MTDARTPGMVSLVGAGPGDPGLLTLSGMRCLAEAEVVVHDALVNPRLLDHAPASAERIYVGKSAGRHTLPQEEINRLLVERASAGKRVVRLKGGDPFIFGRGGEEAEALAAAGIPFEVVPGVTSAIAGPAYAGIPLTHRDFTASVAFVTGHEDPAKADSGIAWDRLATGAGTLVFLMGVGRLPEIVAQLTRHGRAPETPAAVVRWGTRPDQEVVTGTLAELVEKTRGMRPPALIVVGEVVRLRERLAWFERRPLFGKRVLVTRAREQASELTRRLEAAGAEVVEYPAIAILPPESFRPLDAALGRLREFSWLILTSVNGVRFFWERLQAAGKDARALAGLRVAAIGPATAAALGAHGIRADLVPGEFKAEGLLEGLAGEALSGAGILIARAAEAREILPEALRARGARVEVVPAYRTVKNSRDVAPLRAMLEERAIQVVTFTSSSTVTHFLDLAGPEPARLLEGVLVASIGPVTAQTAARHGIVSQVVPDRYTIPALVEALAAHVRAAR